MFQNQFKVRAPALAALCMLMVSACSESVQPPQKLMVAEADARPLVFPKPGYLLDTIYADLSNDALIPPDEPTLIVNASPGKLTLSWDGIAEPHTATLFRYDTLNGNEQEIETFPGSRVNAVTLDSRTHLTAWHRQQFRVELCTPEDCTSSARVATTHLAPLSVQAFSPGVFVKGERYAQDVALNHDASLLVISLPVEGSLDMRQRIGDEWIALDRVRLADLPLSDTRQMDMTLSHSGNTIAILLSHGTLPGSVITPSNHQVIILERLGEAWIETSRLPLHEHCHLAAPIMGQQATQAEPSNALASHQPSSIQLSANGDMLLVSCADTLLMLEQQFVQWSITQAWMPTPATSNEQLLGVTANADLSRIFTASRVNQQLEMGIWQNTSVAPSENIWHKTGAHELTGVDPFRDVHLAAEQSGNAVGIAGWENSNTTSYTPVFWRYGVATHTSDTGFENSTQITAMDSFRQGPAAHADATLRLAADAQLTTIALAWHGNYSTQSSVHNDAALTTYLYKDSERYWQPALELPESIPTLAKLAFARQLLLSGDASTLVMTGPANSPSRPGQPVDVARVLR